MIVPLGYGEIAEVESYIIHRVKRGAIRLHPASGEELNVKPTACLGHHRVMRLIVHFPSHSVKGLIRCSQLCNGGGKVRYPDTEVAVQVLVVAVLEIVHLFYQKGKVQGWCKKYI